MFNSYFAAGCLVWGILFWILFYLRPKSKIHEITIEKWNRKEKITVLLAVLFTILLCILPMGLAPMWNGENPGDRNQYEEMAESILHGHLYLEHDIDPLLLEMENPYDTVARNELNVKYRWDHAFYNGRYYMYFGIIPVLLIFLPFRFITGMNLTTYHATQVFVAFFICGIFAVFYLLAKKFFKNITFGLYLWLSIAFSIMSIWYSVEAPAMYCTAITAGVCMEIWSMYFFIRAVWFEEREKKSIFYAFFGSLFGAMAFGCRPPIALANLFVIPMLIIYLKNHPINWKRIGQLAIAASPYFIIAVLLMVYNYVRFDNPFEFGQTYQLTVADQSDYGNVFLNFHFSDAVNGILYNFISYTPIEKEFPYLSLNGAFINFPILCFSVIGLASEGVRAEIKKKSIRLFLITLFFLPLFITIIDVMWTPFLNERYRMDIYWIMGILCFLIIGFYYKNLSEYAKRKFSFGITVWAFVTICTCVLLFLVPNDSNYTMYFPESIEKIKNILKLGRGVE